MDIREHVGAAIARVRRDCGLSQDELGYRAGVDQGYMSRIESGTIDIGLLLLGKISAGLNVNPDVLLKGFDGSSSKSPDE